MTTKKRIFYLMHLFISLNLSDVYASCVGIACSCSIAAGTFNLGSYAPLSGNPTNNSSNLSVTCSALVAGLDVSYVISINKGTSTSFSPRTMTLSSSVLNYNIYTTSGLTSIWGDGTSGTVTVSDSYLLSLLSVTRNYTMFGNIPASQNVAPGTYNDSLTATVTY